MESWYDKEGHPYQCIKCGKEGMTKAARKYCNKCKLEKKKEWDLNYRLKRLNHK